MEYSANNSTGFTSDLELSQVNALTEVEAAPQQVNCSFILKVVFQSSSEGITHHKGTV